MKPSNEVTPAPSNTRGVTGRPTVLFVGGAHRSGTTLLGRMLGQIDGVSFVGELDRLRFNIAEGRLCGCKEPIERCAFWAEVGRRALGSWDRADVRARLSRTRALKRRQLLAAMAGGLGPRARRVAEEHAALLAPVVQAIHAVDHGRLIVDTSKTPMVLAALARARDVDVRLVHIVRDPRGVAYSRGKKRLLEPGVFHWQMSPHRASLHWSFDNLAFDQMRARGLPGVRLRYEDLVADPVTQIERLGEILQLALGPLDFIDGSRVTLGLSHSLSGNPMRFQEGPIELRLDDEWREKLAARRRREVVALTWPLLRRYGYGSRAGD